MSALFELFWHWSRLATTIIITIWQCCYNVLKFFKADTTLKLIDLRQTSYFSCGLFRKSTTSAFVLFRTLWIQFSFERVPLTLSLKHLWQKDCLLDFEFCKTFPFITSNTAWKFWPVSPQPRKRIDYGCSFNFVPRSPKLLVWECVEGLEWCTKEICRRERAHCMGFDLPAA